MSCKTTRGLPGGLALTVSTAKVPDGFGRGSGGILFGNIKSNSLSRFRDWRAATKLFQLAIASSTGANARETKMELAIMTPAVAS